MSPSAKLASYSSYSPINPSVEATSCCYKCSILSPPISPPSIWILPIVQVWVKFPLTMKPSIAILTAIAPLLKMLTVAFRNLLFYIIIELHLENLVLEWLKAVWDKYSVNTGWVAYNTFVYYIIHGFSPENRGF